MRVALVIPGSEHLRKRQMFRDAFRPPPAMGVAYVAAALRAGGHEVKVFDQFNQRWSYETLAAKIRSFEAEVVGYSCQTPNVPDIAATNKLLLRWRPEILLIAGNSHASEYPATLINSEVGIQVVVHNEGEETVVDLLRAHSEKRDFGSVRGITYINPNGKLEKTQLRAPIKNLDALVYPAWDLMPLEFYKNSAHAFSGNTRYLPVLQTRGCAWKCRYCAQNFFRDDVPRRKIAKVVDEIEWLMATFNVDMVPFFDTIFPLVKKDGLEFVEEVERRKLAGKFNFTITTRVDLIDREVFTALKSIGLNLVTMGIDSHSDEILNTTAKFATQRQAFAAIDTLRELGIHIYGNYVLGLEGSTRQTLQETLAFALKLDTDMATFSRMTVLAGSPLDREIKSIEDPRYRDSVNPWLDDPHNPTPIPHTQLTIGEVARFQKFAMFRYYVRPKMIARHLLKRGIPLDILLLGGIKMAISGFGELIRQAFAKIGRLLQGPKTAPANNT